jgi:hypothetical protein
MIIPDKNVFIVTSSLKPTIGVYSYEERMNQTIASLKSIRKKVPDAIIVVTDVSVKPLTEMEVQMITHHSNVFINSSDEPNTKFFSERGMKSHAENALLFSTLLTLKQNPQISHILNSTKRLFKFSARSELEDGFDINEYDNLFGKYVFKKRIPTWMNQLKNGADNLLITRMFSFCPSLIDNYLGVIQKNIPIMNELDTEHAHFENIPEKYLVEFDRIYCWGYLAGTGKIEHY